MLIGYQVTNTLTVKVRDLDIAGCAIHVATEAAGYLIRINSVNFPIKETKPIKSQARKGAIADM